MGGRLIVYLLKEKGDERYRKSYRRGIKIVLGESCNFIENWNIEKYNIVLQFLNKALFISNTLKKVETPSSLCFVLIYDDASLHAAETVIV